MIVKPNRKIEYGASVQTEKSKEKKHFKRLEKRAMKATIRSSKREPYYFFIGLIIAVLIAVFL
ncbi:MAG: hypothetical protein PSN34_00690 [Urechidicola sp.]|nr:hypothetical protein [Urechidicola sp.]